MVRGELARDPRSPEAVRLLRYLESNYHSAPDDIKNAIDVSFVEDLAVDGPGVQLLGRQCQQAARELGVLTTTQDHPGSSLES
jgi:hypothetical protein